MLSGVTRYEHERIYGDVTVGGDRGRIVVGAARFGVEVFGAEEPSERRGFERGRKLHGLWRRALIFLGKLEGEGYVSPS